MSAALHSLPSYAVRAAEGILAQVNSLVDRLRARAPETERLRRMHPDNLRELTEAQWPAEQDDGWRMTAITAKLLGAKGAYRSPDLKSGGALFMVFTDIRWAPGAGPG